MNNMRRAPEGVLTYLPPVLSVLVLVVVAVVFTVIVLLLLFLVVGAVVRGLVWVKVELGTIIAVGIPVSRRVRTLTVVPVGGSTVVAAIAGLRRRGERE